MRRESVRPMGEGVRFKPLLEMAECAIKENYILCNILKLFFILHQKPYLWTSNLFVTPGDSDYIKI